MEHHAQTAFETGIGVQPLIPNHEQRLLQQEHANPVQPESGYPP